MQRDERGRFLPGNRIAQAGGQARMARLTPLERTKLARQGFAALAQKYWGGNKRAAAAWLFDPLGYHTQEG